MGNQFEIGIVHDDESTAMQLLDACVKEIKRIESLLTTFSDTSETAAINRNAEIQATKVSEETFNLIQRSIKMSNLTQGAFDITYGSIDQSLWNFDTTMTTLPSAEIAKKSVELINYKNIILDHHQNTVFLMKRGMRIGFGGIGKGYAADMAKKILISNNIENGYVNASGDLTAWGVNIDSKPWSIGITDPNYKEEIFSTIAINNQSVATSGSYEKYAIIDGKRYSHTINPKTGLPVSGIKSVSILAPTAELADALATPVMVMGVEVGMDMINQLNGIEAIVVSDDNKIYKTDKINMKTSTYSSKNN
jgi:FAD:protein FMN transferase